MFQTLATYPVGDRSLFEIFGIVAIILFLAAAIIPFLQSRAILNISMKWHMRIAGTALTCALLHVLLIQFI